MVGNENSKYCVFTADGSEFHLDEFDEYTGTGYIIENGIKKLKFKFHPENVISITERLE